MAWRVPVGALAALLLALAAPGLASAQADPPAWALVDGRAREAAAESRAAGYAAVPVASLRALGAEVVTERGATRVRIGDAELILRAGSPFFTANGRTRQLVDPPYEREGALYVPVQLLVDHLPALLGAELAVDLASRTVRRARAPADDGPGRVATAAAPAPATRAPVTKPAGPETAAPAPTAAPARASTSRRLVVLDAGHGGVDPGALGPSGAREKDVALAVARRVAAILREDPSLEVRMTRDRDTLIALADRTRLANGWRREGQPALFMSIHTNAHDQRGVRGFETFFLSEAKTDDARRVAEMENAAQRYESPSRELDPLRFIMHDLRQNEYLRDSSAWAALVQERLAAVHPGPNRGVKQAGFVVLNGAFMPAVLVELGFITHQAEERMLTSADHQARLARQLASAVKDFFAPSATGAAR